MKSLPVIGVPSDQAASGLISYSIVCGSSLVCSALVSRSLFITTSNSGVVSNACGYTRIVM